MAKQIMYNRGKILSCDMRDFTKYYGNGKFNPELAKDTRTTSVVQS